VSNIEEQLALRARLQAVEDDLLAAGKRHVITPCVVRVFERGLPDALHEPAEETQAGDPQEIEDMIIGQGWQDIMVATDAGTFTWNPK
jgi:hypothetical protein